VNHVKRLDSLNVSIYIFLKLLLGRWIIKA